VPRLQPQDPVAVAEALSHDEPTRAELKLLSKHFLGLLEQRAPGKSVEVRVPPFAAAQVIAGVRHTRGTPPAVVELDGPTWIALATGRVAWADAMAEGRIRASGERADLSPYLPLVP
jgi:hypothetical protein